MVLAGLRQRGSWAALAAAALLLAGGVAYAAAASHGGDGAVSAHASTTAHDGETLAGACAVVICAFAVVTVIGIVVARLRRRATRQGRSVWAWRLAFARSPRPCWPCPARVPTLATVRLRC